MSAPAFLRAFESPSYRRLWTGAFLSSLGTWTQDVALAWLIHTRFGNPLYLGFRSLAAEAPLVAFMLVGGAVADRFDRKRILLVSQILQMSFAAALMVLFLMDRLDLPFILALAFLTGTAQSQSAPTYQAVLPTLVPPSQIPNAVALNSLQFNLSRTIGPVVAGLLLVRAGAGACFGANALSFVAVIVALARITIPPVDAPPEGLRESLATGFRHLLGSRVLFLLTALGAASSFLTYPLITYLPVIAGDLLHTGAAGFSMLLSSFGVGAIGGAVTTAHRGSVAGRGRLLLNAWIVYGVATLGALVAGRQWLTMALMVVSGWTLVTASSTLISLVQEHVPDHLRGRMMSIYGTAFRGGMPIGSLVAGFAVGAWGVGATIGALTAILLAGALMLRARSRVLSSL